MPKSRKIAQIAPLMPDRDLCVTVEPAVGINGRGESEAWGFLDASQEVVTRLHGRGQRRINADAHWPQSPSARNVTSPA